MFELHGSVCKHLTQRGAASLVLTFVDAARDGTLVGLSQYPWSCAGAPEVRKGSCSSSVTGCIHVGAGTLPAAATCCQREFRSLLDWVPSISAPPSQPPVTSHVYSRPRAAQPSLNLMRFSVEIIGMVLTSLVD